MPDVLIASDSPGVRDEVRACLPDDTSVREVTRGAQVRPAVAEKAPDLVILDLQIGAMGGMATCLDLRLEAGAGRLPHVPVLMLLDRRADPDARTYAAELAEQRGRRPSRAQRPSDRRTTHPPG